MGLDLPGTQCNESKVIFSLKLWSSGGEDNTGRGEERRDMLRFQTVSQTIGICCPPNECNMNVGVHE